MIKSVPRYATSTGKALEAILWLVDRSGDNIDMYHLVKAVFFADKMHVSNYGRPIIGDDYRAAQFGPLAQTVYNLLRGQPFEILSLNLNGRPPFRVEPVTFKVHGEREPNLRKLSKSDVDALEFGWNGVQAKSFDDLFQETHADQAWIRANGGMMDYRDFIQDNADNVEAKREYLEDMASYAYV